MEQKNHSNQQNTPENKASPKNLPKTQQEDILRGQQGMDNEGNTNVAKRSQNSDVDSKYKDWKSNGIDASNEDDDKSGRDDKRSSEQKPSQSLNSSDTGTREWKSTDSFNKGSVKPEAEKDLKNNNKDIADKRKVSEGQNRSSENVRQH